jgi:hypothetical protein
LESKPILLQHKPVTATDHPKNLVVGSIANPSFEDGIVYGDLVLWSQDAIDAVESKELPALSLGYRYRLDATPGTTPDGEPYDGRMLDIAMNHCALVAEPRIEGAIVNDSAKGFKKIGRTFGTTSNKGTKMQQRISRAFGLDDSRCRGRDETSLSKLDGPKAAQDGEEENPAAARVLELLRGKLSPEEIDELVALIGEMGESDEDEGRRADGDNRPGLRDHDGYEPDASDDAEEMRPNGLQRSRHSLSEDVDETGLKENLRRIGRTLSGTLGRKPESSAMDAAAAEASFRARFPNLPRDTRSGIAFCQTRDGTGQFRNRPREPLAADSSASASFFSRYPNAAKVQR